MSKFEAAQRKAAGTTAAPKPAAKPAAAAPKASSAAKAVKAPKLDTLENKRLYVRQQEVKIEDMEDKVKDEPNKIKRKELETTLKNLKTDEFLIKAKEGIKEDEAQKKRDDERAALASGSKKADDGAVAFERLVSDAGEQADAEIMKGIDTAFAASGKDAAAAKAAAITRIETLASSTAFTLPRVESLIAFFADSKLGAPAVKAACKIVNSVKPPGHCIAIVVMPCILAGMEDKRWKIKAGCIEVLSPCLKQMAAGSPAQLAVCLPQIVNLLAAAALEVRAEIRTATGVVLREIGNLVASPEIKKLSQDLVTALADPTNQKHTQGVLALMGNQTFMSLIDPASLALLMPIVGRGLKAPEAASKKWSAQIFGSTAILVKDIEMMRPYLKLIVPMLQDALTDPVQEVQREAAKAYGVLEQVLPEFSQRYCQPWLFKKLVDGDPGEIIGSALGLAEVLLKMEKKLASELIPEILAGASSEKWSTKKGFLELLDTMPQAMKMDFVPYIESLFPPMIMGITGDKDPVEDPAIRAALALVQRFGDLCPELLLTAFEGTYAATLNGQSAEQENRFQIIRERSTVLLGKMTEKILEHKKFGQDLLTTDECSTKATRERLLILVFAMRSDPDAGVKRVANGIWKTAGGAPKVQKAIAPAVEKKMLLWREGIMGAGMQSVAIRVLESLVTAGEIEATAGETPEPEAFVFPKLEPCNSEAAASIRSGECKGTLQGIAEEGRTGSSGQHACAAEEFLESDVRFLALPADIRNHCGRLAASVTLEAEKRKVGGKALAAELAAALKAALGDAGASFDEELPLIAEAAARAALGDAFDKQMDDADAGGQTLLHVENLLLMYGAGHLLLKDTTLVMKMNQRYGIVGQNGAGKTTLMKEIADHRIVGMPQELKCVHVDDSKLGEMTKSTLSCNEYVVKMAKAIGVEVASGRDTLLEVGFKEKMLDDPVSELSTGWRMRLTLGVSMLKHADLVLLDEPTNHLDEESVAWLAQYINSISESSVMVISHEPKFLNKVCTHVVAYVDKKLEYTEGNFDVFASRKGLSKDQIDKMLSGNLTFNTKAEGDESDEEGSDMKSASASVKVAGPIAGPPKLSFPIPGTCEGVKSGSKSVMELRGTSFRFGADKDFLVNKVDGKLSLNSRIAICGRNGCGKSALMTLLCSEVSPSEGEDGKLGEVWRHHNLRLGYLKQDHLKALGPFFDTSPFVYITDRFKDGYDGDLQKRLIEPEDEAEAGRRALLAKAHGKYGNAVGDLLSRNKVGSKLMYEVQWEGLEDQKQNTMESIDKLKKMGLDKVVIACDERIAAKAAGLDQRPLTRREVVRHCEAFGIDEEMCCNRQIRGFSAGQKVRLSLAAMFWTKPHFICVDEPTNYLDVETVEALAKALINFRGGIAMIEPKTDFVERICNVKWHMDGGAITVEQLENANKRQA